MRTVKSVSELQRIAVNNGAVIRLDGRTINAQGAKALAVAPKAAPTPDKPQPEATAPALTQERPDPRPELYALMAEQARDQARLTETLMQTLAQRDQAPAAPRVPWRFEVVYDREGRITEVIANPMKDDT